jgi:hypothetical protein
MAVSTRTMHRQRDYSRLFIALGILAGVMAVAPIVAAVLGIGGASVNTRTAFASAPAGEYAVLGRSEGNEDVISVAWAQHPGAVTEVVRVPHLEGFTSIGAVSPDGRKLALVSVDGGSRTQPVASLNVVNLETGQLVKAAEKIVPGQTPVWDNNSKQLVATRMPYVNAPSATIEILSVGADGKGERIIGSHSGVLGVYPIAFDAKDRLVSVVVNGEGSILRREGAGDVVISAHITRDWKLSPDGSELAFIEADTSGGVRYLARTMRVDGAASPQALTAPASALGTAWTPNGRVTFGLEPGQQSGGSEQALTAGSSSEAGFDVPLGYSESGDALVVTHWSGPSFQESGKPTLQLVTPQGRQAYETYTRFYGWSER